MRMPGVGRNLPPTTRIRQLRSRQAWHRRSTIGSVRSAVHNADYERRSPTHRRNAKMMRRITTGQFDLPIPASEAIDYFTPEGERSWVTGWDPTYPAGQPAETDGTVFVTSHDNIETIWIIDNIDRDGYTSAYSRVTIGRHAGTVRVRCDDQPGGQCIVSVSYDMTSLNPQHPEALDAYNESSFHAMMNEWATGVSATLNSKPRP